MIDCSRSYNCHGAKNDPSTTRFVLVWDFRHMTVISIPYPIELNDYYLIFRKKYFFFEIPVISPQGCWELKIVFRLLKALPIEFNSK